MVFAILTAWLAYKKAKQSGRNAILWAIIGGVVFVGTQLAIAMVIGVGFGFGELLWSWPETIYDDYDIPVRIISLGAGFLMSWLLLRYLDGQPTDEALINSPPQPPSFGGDI